jgi:hypothetical protein
MAATLFSATFRPALTTCNYFGVGLKAFFGLPLAPPLNPCNLTGTSASSNSLTFGFSENLALGVNYTQQMLSMLADDPAASRLAASLVSLDPPINLRTLAVQPLTAPSNGSSFPLTTPEMIVIGGGVGVLIAVLIVIFAIRSRQRKEERLRGAMTAMNQPMEDRAAAAQLQRDDQKRSSPHQPGGAAAARKKTRTSADPGNEYVPPTVAAASPERQEPQQAQTKESATGSVSPPKRQVTQQQEAFEDGTEPQVRQATLAFRGDDVNSIETTGSPPPSCVTPVDGVQSPVQQQQEEASQSAAEEVQNQVESSAQDEATTESSAAGASESVAVTVTDQVTMNEEADRSEEGAAQ